MKKGFIITAAALIISGIALLSAAFIASGFDFSKLDVLAYETKTYTVNENFSNIEINSINSDIFIEPSEDGSFSVVCFEREKISYSVSVVGETLKINYSDERIWLDYIAFSFRSPYIKIYLPKKDYGSLSVKNSTGDLIIENEFSFKSVDITASTGDVKLKSVSCEENISVILTTGKTDLTDINCKNLSLKGSTGDVALKNVFATENLSVEKTTGDVNFIDSDAENITVKTSTGDVTGTFISDKIFNVKTSTGKIDLPNSNSGGTCKITTSTGDIIIKISRV